MCTIKNVQRNNPVRAMMNFWPMVEENILVTQFIDLIVLKFDCEFILLLEEYPVKPRHLYTI
jgi:hypothetical protein